MAARISESLNFGIPMAELSAKDFAKLVIESLQHEDSNPVRDPVRDPVEIKVVQRGQDATTRIMGLSAHGIQLKRFQVYLRKRLALRGRAFPDSDTITLVDDHGERVKCILMEEYNIEEGNIKVSKEIRPLDEGEEEEEAEEPMKTKKQKSPGRKEGEWITLGDLRCRATDRWAGELRRSLEKYIADTSTKESDTSAKESDTSTKEKDNFLRYFKKLKAYCETKRKCVALEREFELERLGNLVIKDVDVVWQKHKYTWVGWLNIKYGMNHFRNAGKLLLETYQRVIEVLVVDLDPRKMMVKVIYEPDKVVKDDEDERRNEDSDDSDYDEENDREFIPPKRVDLKFVFEPTPYSRQTNALDMLCGEDKLSSRDLKDPVRMALTSYFLGIKVIQKQEYENIGFDVPERIIPGLGKSLDESQLKAVAICLKNPFSMIQGPPGTGKTTTIAGLVYYYLSMYPRAKILVCGPSNVSTDHLAACICRISGVKTVRCTSRSVRKVDPRIFHINISTLCLERNPELRALEEKRNHYKPLSKEEREKYNTLYWETYDEILDEASVICATASMSGSLSMKYRRFNFVIVDEVGQARDSECVIPFVHADNKIVFVGDQMQLGPCITCPLAKSLGGGKSLFDRLIETGFMPFQLTIQYRMHPAISEFPSRTFYDNNIIDGVTAEEKRNKCNDFWPVKGIPMVFVNVDGKEEKKNGTIIRNECEADYVHKVLMTLRERGVDGTEIGIITPYQGQRELINSMLWTYDKYLQEWYDNITISTVDGFQGSEKKYIIISCVRNNDHDEIGFVRDDRRMNVSITRAEVGLIIIGSVEFLYKHEYWKLLIDHFNAKHLVVRGTDMYPAPSSKKPRRRR